MSRLMNYDSICKVQDGKIETFQHPRELLGLTFSEIQNRRRSEGSDMEGFKSIFLLEPRNEIHQRARRP